MIAPASGKHGVEPVSCYALITTLTNVAYDWRNLVPPDSVIPRLGQPPRISRHDKDKMSFFFLFFNDLGFCRIFLEKGKDAAKSISYLI